MMLEGMATQEGVHLQLHHTRLSGEDLEQYSDQVVKLWTSASQPCLHVRITWEAVTEWPAGYQDL